MDNSRRKTIAFICGMHYADKSYSCIYDYARSAYYSLDYTCIENAIEVYDYERRCYVSGSLSSIFDYGESNYLEFRIIREGVIEVYDYKTSTFFEATCKDKNVSLYDYQSGQYFEYQLS